jgi:hypothetical protein
MNTLGIRAKPSEVVIAIYDTSEDALLNVERIKIPKALATPEALKYVRNTVLDVLREYDIRQAGIRITESSSQQLSVRRIEIEGVIQEAFASSPLKSYYVGQISNISSRLGFDRSNFKRYVSSEIDFDRVENWDDLDGDEKEAVLTSLGAVNA